MFTMLIALLILLIIEVGVVLYYLRQYFHRMNLNNIIDPFYPVFSKDIILKAKIGINAAEEKFLAAYDKYQENGEPSVDQTLVNSHFNFITAQERFHRLIEGNIAALNGKKISSIVAEHDDWLRKRELEFIKAKSSEEEWIQKAQLLKKS